MNKYEKLARKIVRWCKKNCLWYDIIIYFNGKAWSTSPRWNGDYGKQVLKDVYEFENKNPKNYFESANPDTLSMSFEGTLYYILNGYITGSAEKFNSFKTIFDEFNMYFDFGDAWNISAFENK